MHFCAGNGRAVFVHTLHGHARQAALALDACDGVREIQRNIKIVQALYDVAGEAAGIGHYLYAGQHLRALQRHAARHDQADIARAEDHHTLAHHVALDVQIALCRARRKHARGAPPRNGDGPACALAAAHAQHDRRRLQHNVAVARVHRVHLLFGGDGQHHRIGFYLHVRFLHQLDKAPGILRAGELFLKIMQAEAVVDALV